MLTPTSLSRPKFQKGPTNIQAPCRLVQLPLELFMCIFDNLDAYDQIVLLLTCKALLRNWKMFTLKYNPSVPRKTRIRAATMLPSQAESLLCQNTKLWPLHGFFCGSARHDQKDCIVISGVPVRAAFASDLRPTSSGRKHRSRGLISMPPHFAWNAKRMLLRNGAWVTQKSARHALREAGLKQCLHGFPMWTGMMLRA